MWKHSHRLWIGATAMLTILLAIILFPILYTKYELVRAILLSGLLVVGMLLYYLRGILLSRIRK